MQTIDLLKRIWTVDIAKDLQSGTLINERTLQAAIYHHLRNQEVQNFNLGLGIPDMVIVNTGEGMRMVEAVIELKMLPKDKGIVYEDDIKKLVGWTQAVNIDSCIDDKFDVDPKTLYWAGDPYQFTSKTNWIFAAIGAAGCGAFDLDCVSCHATSCINKEGIGLNELNLWLFPGFLDGCFGPPERIVVE